MNIRPLTHSDIDTAVALHLATLGDTTSSKIGKEYLTDLYKKIIKLSPLVLTYGSFEQNQLTGVIVATKDLSQLQFTLSPLNAPVQLYHIVKALFTRSVSISELARKIRFERAIISTFKTPYPSILLLYVSPLRQKKGIGKSLLRKVTHEWEKNKSRVLYVDTLDTNKNAQKFYEKMGFKKACHIEDSIVYTLIIK